jgi:hypothetical protein
MTANESFELVHATGVHSALMIPIYQKGEVEVKLLLKQAMSSIYRKK